MSAIKGIPFDAPLYQRDIEHGGVFLNCQAVHAVFTIASDIKRLLAKELVPAADPAMGIVAIARYGTRWNALQQCRIISGALFATRVGK